MGHLCLHAAEVELHGFSAEKWKSQFCQGSKLEEVV